MPIAAVYISEIAKARQRGRFVILYECIFTLGLFVSGFIGSFIVPRFGWEMMFFIGTAPILIALSLRSALPSRHGGSPAAIAWTKPTVPSIRIELEIRRNRLEASFQLPRNGCLPIRSAPPGGT